MRKLITLLLLSLIQVSLLGCSSQNYVKPDLGMTSRLAGKAYTEGRCDDAIPHYIDIINEFPQDTDSRLRIANCLYLTGDVSGAVEEYKIILRSDPTHSSAWYNLSYIQIEELFSFPFYLLLQQIKFQHCLNDSSKHLQLQLQEKYDLQFLPR